MKKIALLTNIPAPYREKIHELVSQKLSGNYQVIYCARKEANRDWQFEYGNYDKIFITEVNKTAVHNNLSIIKFLQRYNPDIIIIMGFYPSMLYGWLWSLIKNRKLIVFTDGTASSESKLTLVHKLIRKLVFNKTSAFIGPASGSQKLYAQYGINEKKFFRTYLCANNSNFFSIPIEQKEFDIMFSGQFIERKLPFFFIEVANYIKNKTGTCKVLILGSGPLKNEILNKLNSYQIDFSYPGFVDQKELPNYYSKAKLFLFPTENDPWGVVANEAMASGVPVITCENAGVAGDLVINEKNGFVLPIDVNIWAEKIITILCDTNYYNYLSMNAVRDVQTFNYENAALGILNAIQYVNKTVK